MSTQPPPIVHEDPDRTDELPVFDPVAYEANAAAEESLSRTDAWRVPQDSELHAARISALEAELENRDSALNALRDDLQHTAAAKTQVASQLNGILEQIHALQGQLAESEANTASLQARQNTLELEKKELENRIALLSTELDNTHAALGRSEKRIAELTAEVERAKAQTHSETERTAQARSELIDAEERIRELYGKLDAQTTSAKEVARLFATQYARADELMRALETHKEKLQRTEDTLQQRDAELQALNESLATHVADARGRYTELEGAHNVAKNLAQDLQSDLERSRQETSTLQNQLAAADTTITERNANIADLNKQIATRQSALEEKTIALTNTEQALTRAGKNIAELDTALGTHKREIEQLRDNERELNTKLAAQHDEVEGWRTRTEAAEQKSTALQQELTAANARVAELTQALETAQSRDTNVQHELKRTHEEVHALATDLGTRNSKIAALESQLAAHADALSAIRRDIARVSSKRTGDSSARKLVAADRSGRSFMLTNGTLSIGRTDENDIQIASNMVSRRHAQLLVGPNAVILEDLGSTNGCYVNSRQVKKHLLQDGDIVLIGQDRYRYVAPAQAQENTSEKE